MAFGYNLKIKCSHSPSSAPIFILSEMSGSKINVEYGDSTSLEVVSPDGQVHSFSSVNSICRFLARISPGNLYGKTNLEKTEVDHWLEYCNIKYSASEFIDCLVKLDKSLSLVTYLVGDSLSLADICVWAMLYANKQFHAALNNNPALQNLNRWFSFLKSNSTFQSVMNAFPIEDSNVGDVNNKVKTEDRGKFTELPGAEMGKVIVRFPPEASGYLHIGHAKAALLNAHYQVSFEGKLIMRFDDTNPEKEKEDFEKVILEDVEMLEIKPDMFTFTSDHFELLLQKCEVLLKSGLAFVDDTDPETMKLEREQRVESKNRTNTVEKNWAMWEEMKKGTEYGKSCCVRAKMDMQSDNGCMRDPTLYRCKSMTHPRTGNRFKVYPTYDFACPIVDSVEGVTHALRTTEYHDRDEQYFWVLDALGMRRPYIYEYSRLNMTNTVLSKRKLTWFVQQGIVDSWDDPRMPTVRGVLRRGLTVEGLRRFIVAQGSSRSVVVMEWDKIWAFNKKVIDPIAPRYNAVEKDKCIPVTVEGATYQSLSVPKHPKNPELGMKDLFVGPKLFVDSADADLMKAGENVTFINWGNLMIVDVKRDGSGNVMSVSARLNLDNKDYKKTLKVTWVLDHPEQPLVPCMCVYYDHLILKPILGKDEDFKDFINPSTKIEVEMLGDALLGKLKKGDIVQIQRKGFFICDEIYDMSSLRHTSREGHLVLISIPDGSKDTTSLPEIVRKARDAQLSEKEKVSSAKGKVAEKSPREEVKGICDTPNSEMDLDSRIKAQGDKVRNLKTQKAEKAVIDAEVKNLLQLKESYKKCTGKDWKPNPAKPEPEATKKAAKEGASSLAGSQEILNLDGKIRAQGNVVRQLKSEKADKSAIDSAVKMLLELKDQFKNLSNIQWKPDLKFSDAVDSGESLEAGDQAVSKLDTSIRSQGDVVRKLKSEKADKSTIDENVKLLLKLKEEYKNLSGKDWKPDSNLENSKNPKIKKVSSGASLEAGEQAISKLDTSIKSQGDIVRKLKSEKADKSVIDENVKLLLKLKEEYKSLSGKDWKPDTKSNSGDSKSSNPGNIKSNKQSNSKNNPDANKEAKNSSNDAESGIKKITRLGLEVKKDENLSEWYSQVLTKAEMIEYYDVSGCYILRPWAYAVWEAIQKFFDAAIKSLGVTNCYFPMFVSSAALEKEKTHIEDFAPEVAWVTKSGSSDLDKAIAIRPTSETVMYPSYAKWIRSHRDLPLRLNQWCNVVRWEFRNPQPFIRTREFLWQEGHTAFATRQEAVAEVRAILDLYARVYEELLAIPVIRGRKTEREKFAGADFTTTTEAYVPGSGRGIQGATSHHLGKNFSKMFDIAYEDPDTGDHSHVYQNSWGMSTRTIGAMVLIHGDDTGLVMPPRVAACQCVIVPCGVTANLKESEKQHLYKTCTALEETLKGAGVLVRLDSRDNYSPGWKFNYWELKGVPVRIELGPKDIKKNQFVAVRRDTGEKMTWSMDGAPGSVVELLDNIHQSMYEQAKKNMEERLCISYDWRDFCSRLDQKFIIQAPFCGEVSCEENIKKDSARNADESLEPGAPSMGAKSLCIPFDQPAELKPDTKCIYPKCTLKPKCFTLFGRSY